MSHPTDATHDEVVRHGVLLGGLRSDVDDHELRLRPLESFTAKVMGMAVAGSVLGALIGSAVSQAIARAIMK